MILNIVRKAEKIEMKAVDVVYTATIENETLSDYYIFRKALGITSEMNSGILYEKGGGVIIKVGEDWYRFNWSPLNTECIESLQQGIQQRINDVKKWIATLNYPKNISIETKKFTVEI